VFVDVEHVNAHLVSGGGEMCRYLFVYGMHMLFFIGFTSFHAAEAKVSNLERRRSIGGVEGSRRFLPDWTDCKFLLFWVWIRISYVHFVIQV
jgi:hypothetical protein